MAVNSEPVEKLPPKPLSPSRCVGRLDAVEAARPRREALALAPAAPLGGATLTIVGDGPERAASSAGQRARARSAVASAGRCRRVGEGCAPDCADLLVGCSAREGWGLTVTEAALLGTPAVVYDVPGFRDSVVHERTRLLTAPYTGRRSQRACGAASRTRPLPSLQKSAWVAARGLSWERTADAFEAALREAVAL